MATIKLRIPDSKHERLKLLAQNQGVSLNKLVEEWAAVALAQFDAEVSFQTRAARGRAKRGLALLDKLDAAFSTGKKRKR